MKILELCPFSQGVCGVWARVKSESDEFIKLGHKVLVLSSDLEKGTGRHVERMEEEIDNIQVKRFASKNSLLSENVQYWFSKDTEKALTDYNPDVIITHLLHPHSAKICSLIPTLKERNPNVKIFIVPHAPFNVKRRFPLNIATLVWRMFSRLNLNSFDKVIAITKWEYPFLNLPADKIVYIPNGLPSDYFKQKKSKSKISAQVLFLGRIAPVKSLETLLSAASKLPQVTFSIVGAAEPAYLININQIASKLPNVKIYPPIYSLREKISVFDSHKIFVLPSVREAMPQVLLEAMARSKVVISSSTDGGKEIISDNQDGFLFNISDSDALARLISQNLSGNKQVEKLASMKAKEFQWSKLINRYLALFP